MILMIAITGGPGAGKTTCFDYLKEHKEKLMINNFIPLFIPETATFLLDNNLTSRSDLLSFQTDISKYQLEQEDRVINNCIKSFKNQGNCEKTNYIIFCDRGLMDGKAFLNEEMFSEVMKNTGLKESEIFGRYDYVIHLISPARECPDNYTLKTNKNRTENITEAGIIDKRTEEVWKDHPGYISIGNKAGVPGKYKEVLKLSIDLIRART